MQQLTFEDQEKNGAMRWMVDQGKNKPEQSMLCSGMAGMAGIEPARAESKSAVLPLDYIPI